MLLFQFGTTPEIRERLATRHRWVWIKTDHGVLNSIPSLTGPCNFGPPLALVADLKAINPRVNVGMYVGGLASPDSHHPHYEWLDDADLLHAGPGQALEWSPTTVPHQPQERRVKIINYTRPETRAKLIQHWRAFLAEHDLDGVVFDTFHPGYYAAWMAQAPATPNAHGGWGLPSGGVEGAFHTEVWWFGALATFAAELRWSLAEDGREVWVNGLYDYPNFGTLPDHQNVGQGYSNVARYASGLLAEYGHVMHRSPADLRGNLEAAALVNGQNRGTFWLIQPGAFAYDPSGYSVVDGPDLRRFYLAAFLLLHHPPYTQFGYHPGPMYQAYQEPAPGQYEPWLFDGGEDWDHDYGVALTGVSWAGDVALRQYTRGWAIVNASSNYGYLTLPPGTYRNWHPEAGGLVTLTAANPGMNVPPKSGMFLWGPS